MEKASLVSLFVPLPWRREDGVSPCRVREGLVGSFLPPSFPWAAEVTGWAEGGVASPTPAPMLPGPWACHTPLVLTCAVALTSFPFFPKRGLNMYN